MDNKSTSVMKNNTNKNHKKMWLINMANYDN